MASIQNLNESEFDSTISGASVPVVVDFWAPWCGPCRTIGPILEQLAEEMGDQVQVTKVNVDENQGIAQRFNVRAIPTILFFKDGELKDQVVGLVQKDALKSKIAGL
ncbi:MAG: thioredoxin [Opitutales bacterium]|nr:thioredoxin [Opitutales bacterium]